MWDPFEYLVARNKDGLLKTDFKQPLGKVSYHIPCHGRVQSRAVEGSSGPVAIIQHPDVRRMLMFMRSNTEAARSIAYVAAGYFDVAHHHPDDSVRKEAQGAYEYLVPIVKGWSTEISIDIASTGVQVHGGMGFIEETGAAQYYRDARILTIYEGTTAIQANDLVGRKTSRDGGAVARRFIGQMRATARELAQAGGEHAAIGERLAVAVDAYEGVVDFVVAQFKADIRSVFSGSVPYLKLAGIVHGGWQLARSALAAQRLIADGRDVAFAHAKIATARFFADHMLVTASGLGESVTSGSVGTLAMATEQF
jgi:butyryl-CoA dehydrogenase